jgi:Lar family restriction alleviation protein
MRIFGARGNGEMSNELLPCPFCGGKAEVDRTGERYEYGTGGPNSVMDYGYFAYCTKCSVGTGVSDVPPSSEREAAAEWNRRVDDDKPFPVEVQMPQGVKEQIAIELGVDVNHLVFVVYNDTDKGIWLLP